MKLTELGQINEMGGASLKSVGVKPIARDDIPATVQLVSKISGILPEDLHPLGSVGKTDESGDIDLGVDINKYNGEEVNNRMCTRLGDDNCRFLKGPNIGTYAVPVGGDPSKGLVQVDLMYVENPKWATFSYHSPGKDSQYKGAVRTILLMGIAASYNEPGKDHMKYDPESGDLIIRAGRTLDLNKGLRRIFQHRPPKKRGIGHMKNALTINSEKFRELYPDVDIEHDVVTIDDPSKVLKVLFGESVKPKDVSTAEQVINLIKTKFDKGQQIEIFQKAAERGKGVQNKMELPPEIVEHIK